MTPQAKQRRISQLLKRLDDIEGKTLSGRVRKLIREEQDSVRASTAGTSTFKALEELAGTIEKVQKEPQANRVLGMLNRVKKDSQKSISSLTEAFGASLEGVLRRIEEGEANGQVYTKGETERFLREIEGFRNDFDLGRASTENRNAAIDSEIERVRQEMEVAFDDFGTVVTESDAQHQVSRETTNAIAADVGALYSKLDEIVQDFERRMNILQQSRGGSMNRSILVGGDKATLSKYTDVNLKAGAGVTITYSANQTTKYTDITISATGGGGGITRSVNVVATPTAAGNTPGIDYVYIVSGNTTITLPTAAGNTNLYTIKNAGTGTVTIVPSGADTIDNDTSIVMPVRYTSVDLISDGVSNWSIT